MINIKTEKECVMELIKENRPIVEINLKMAKKHIKKKGIKKASKNKKANKNISSFFEAFMEEAYKQLRLDGLALAKEKMETANESIIEEDVNKLKDKDNTKSNTEVLTNNSKLNNTDTESIANNNCEKVDKNSKSTKKIASNTNNKSDLFNNKISKDTSLEPISETNEKSKKNIISKTKSKSKSKALDCPPSIDNNSEKTELVSPFMEVERTDGSSQLGFSVLTINTPIEKTKKKRCKKRNTNDNIHNESVSQLSLFSLI